MAVPYRNPVRDGEVRIEVRVQCIGEERVLRALEKRLPIEWPFRPADDRIQGLVEGARAPLESGIVLEEEARTASTVSRASVSGSGVCSPSSARP